MLISGDNRLSSTGIMSVNEYLVIEVSYFISSEFGINESLKQWIPRKSRPGSRA
jgi:hypothetical protein